MGIHNGCSLACAEELHFKDQGGAWWDDAAGTALAVRKVGRDGELAFLALAHANDALVPALDHLATAQLELEGLVAIVAGVKPVGRGQGRHWLGGGVVKETLANRS